MIAVNMNERCSVKLTGYGMEVLTMHYGRFISGKELEAQISPDSLGYNYFQLWEIMCIFGPTMFNGMNEVPFEDNVFYFN
ncbi:hypothetical protein ACWGPW_24250 [Paenibacillus chitinolyticus]